MKRKLKAFKMNEFDHWADYSLKGAKKNYQDGQAVYQPGREGIRMFTSILIMMTADMPLKMQWNLMK